MRGRLGASWRLEVIGNYIVMVLRFDAQQKIKTDLYASTVVMIR